jgi:pimeloyl-ACP methyl ester carboxylesterase
MSNLPKGIHVVGEGPAVVLFHSSLSSAKQWMHLVGLLKSHYKVINIDSLGYGEADEVEDESSFNFDTELARVYTALNTIVGDEPFHLVGHSCGGALALKLAVENPHKVLSMSLYEPVAFHLLPEGSEDKKVSDSFAEEVDIEDAFLAAEKFTDFWNREGFFRSLPEKMQLSMSKDMGKVNLDFIGLTSETYTLDDMKKITAPVLMMVGEFTPELSKNLSSLISSAFESVTQVGFPAGHMGPVSHAQEIHPTIARFITDNI